MEDWILRILRPIVRGFAYLGCSVLFFILFFILGAVLLDSLYRRMYHIPADAELWAGDFLLGLWVAWALIPELAISIAAGVWVVRRIIKYHEEE